MIFDRVTSLIGEKGLENLSKCSIIVFGIGGVGGYVTEMLVRSGIGKITLIDFDKVADTNINRQIIALHSSIGKYKVDVMKDRILDINPDCEVIIKRDRVEKSNLEQLLCQDYDYVIDAIDSAENKADLIAFAKAKGYNIISALGAGNRYQIPKFEICDVFSTRNDGLAKKMRKLLKERGVAELKVVYTQETPQKNQQTASIVYYPAMCGCLISSVVINELLNK